MSNVQFYLEAIREQVDVVERLTFQQIISKEFIRNGERLNQEEVEEAWQAWKQQHNA